MSNIVEEVFYRSLITLSEKILSRTIIEVRGLENLPKNRGFIIAANHVNSLDPFVIVVALRGFIKENLLKRGKKFYYIGMRAVKKRIYSFFLNEDMGYLCSTKEGVNRSVELLKEGNAVGIFPEGRRNNSGKIIKGRKGIAFMALQSGAPVIPTACFGLSSWGFYQGLKALQGPKKVYFGEPLQFFPRDLSDLLENPSASLMATGMIMLEIAKLCGKEYEF